MKNCNFLCAVNGKWQNFKICDKVKLWIIPPIIVLLVAIIVVSVIGGTSGSITDGLNVGIDFEGGTILSVKFGEEALSSNENYQQNVDDVVQTIESFGVNVTYVQSSESGVLENSTITFRYKNASSSDAEIATTNENIQAAIKAKFPALSADDPEFVMAESIGKTASTDLINKALLSLLISTALILIYIIFRFELVSGIVAIIALLHDTIMMFALTVIFRVQLNSSFVAAIITIISYSINNTIIVFDRCRENMKPYKGKKGVVYENIGDASIKSTLSRQVYTTFTTFITVFFLAVLGGASIREFTVPIILGLLCGTYSSLFIATPLWSKLSYVAEDIREKHQSGKNAVTYETYDDKGNVVEKEEEPATEKAAKKPQVSKVYKYSKKNTTFKKK